MPKKNSKLDTDITDQVIVLFKIILVLVFIGLILYSYFCVYKPEEKRYIKNSRYAYSIMQDELISYFRKNGVVYKSKDENIDNFCETLRQKYSPKYGSCKIGQVGTNENLRFKNKIYIYGFEKPPIEYMGTLIKDIMIDVDGTKGKNTMGIDRVPVRIYSSGRMGGMLSPVNCNTEDIKRYEMDYSTMCESGINIDFLTSNKPFSYSVLQIGGDKGKSRYLGRNMPFLRADCQAFGGETLGIIEYCEQKNYQWSTACYYDYFCSIEFMKK